MKSSKHRYLLGLACLFILAGMAFFLSVQIVDKPRRPQTPLTPLPYDVQQVNFDNVSSAIRLAGTLTLPRHPAPYPAIVLIPGSGVVDRDGTIAGHQFYLVLADYLTRRGFAVLRSDKRGLGRSSGNFATATSFDFASDIDAGLAFLRSRPDIDEGHIGLVGHSEGGLIGSIVAGRNHDIAFLVLMAGNGISAGEMLLSRTRHQTTTQAKPGNIARELVLQEAVIAAATAPASEDSRMAAVRKLYLAAQDEYGRPFSEDEFEVFLTPWMRTLLAIDPQRLLRQLRCPVLALVGENDWVITAEENVPALERALMRNPRAQVHRLPGLNHFFQTAHSGDLSEVAGIDETISPRALELIGAWAAQQSMKQEN